MTECQRKYNFSHAFARIIIERAFGLLKGQFPSLLTTLAIDGVDLIRMHILACCILYKVCLMKSDEINIKMIEDTGMCYR